MLRKPQGTFYGATAEGGLVKYVMNAPDLTRYSGSTEGGLNGTTVGGLEGNLKEFVNVPLGNGLVAVRLSAWSEWTTGCSDTYGSCSTISTRSSWVGPGAASRSRRQPRSRRFPGGDRPCAAIPRSRN